MLHSQDSVTRYFIVLVILSCIVGIVSIIWQGTIAPFTFLEFWTIKGSLWDAVVNAWPVFLWGICATALLISVKAVTLDDDPFDLIVIGTFMSALAGVLEEIMYRWILFLLAVMVIPVINWIFFGFAGWNIIQWVYMTVLCPVANFFTFGYLESYLMGEYGWWVGVAIISANSLFRDDHKYLGLPGYINAWFLGMYLFWVMFTFGIIAAMIIHFLYNIIVYMVTVFFTVADRRRIV